MVPGPLPGRPARYLYCSAMGCTSRFAPAVRTVFHEDLDPRQRAALPLVRALRRRLSQHP